MDSSSAKDNEKDKMVNQMQVLLQVIGEKNAVIGKLKS